LSAVEAWLEYSSPIVMVESVTPGPFDAELVGPTVLAPPFVESTPAGAVADPDAPYDPEPVPPPVDPTPLPPLALA
jgi:hypothetical protein